MWVFCLAGLSGHFELALFDRVLPGGAGLVNASATVKTSVDLRPFLHRGDEVRFAFANNSYPGGPSKRFAEHFSQDWELRVGAQTRTGTLSSLRSDSGQV